MPYTAIVLDDKSHHCAWLNAVNRNLITAGWRELVHHVTLAMGDASDRFAVGEQRLVTVTHIGEVKGRVTAFRVQISDKSQNNTPHITIACAPNAKPVESNNITEWTPIENFCLTGTIQVC